MSGRPHNPHWEALREHMLAGGTVKEFAADHGMTYSNAGKMAATAGFKKYFLTEIEYADVMVRRREFAKRKAAA